MLLFPPIISESAKVGYKKGNFMERFGKFYLLFASYRSFSSVTPVSGLLLMVFMDAYLYQSNLKAVSGIKLWRK
jgi:hypothetical protein